MLSVYLPTALEERLTEAAKTVGQRPEDCIVQAVTEYLDHLQDLDDYQLAQQRFDALQAGRSRTYTLDEVERELGLAD